MKIETRQNSRQTKLPAGNGYVAHGGVARGLSLLFPSPVGVRTARCGTTELNFGSCAEGIQVGRVTGGTSVGGGSRKRELPTGRRGRGRTGWVPSGSTRRQELPP